MKAKNFIGGEIARKEGLTHAKKLLLHYTQVEIEVNGALTVERVKEYFRDFEVEFLIENPHVITIRLTVDLPRVYIETCTY